MQHYGTEAQKDYYLPRLAKGQEIPCFALTSPYAGSDAGSIPDYGIVCRGSYTHPRTGERFDDVLGLRVSWEKRWITLAPVATILGLAFKMYDPEHLLGIKIPGHHLRAGAHRARRRGHRPSPFPGAAFMNGPTWGKDVFIPLDWIIGGREFAGQGWRMLVECLSVGRCISLPAMSVASGKMSSFVTGAYARIRDQFGLPIGKFEGVDEAMARIGGYTYQMEASQDLALTGLDNGENRRCCPPSSSTTIPSACAKPSTTRWTSMAARRWCWPAQLSGARLSGDSDRHHRGRRQHPDPFDDHLRSGRDPLPSLRAARDEGGDGQ